jgi:GTP-binding protein
VKILSAELVTSASTGGPRDGVLRDDLPQFVFCGRSNVGKSSLLNALTLQKLARTSAAAGKTRQANIYRITAEGQTGGRDPWSMYLVDLPGYGYARGGHDSRGELAAVVDAYLAVGPNRQQRISGPGTSEGKPRGAVFLLVDSRHPGLPLDVQAYQHLTPPTAPYVIATKVDKLSRSERERNLREIERVFGQPALPLSATTGEGLDQLWRLISGLARGPEL